MAHGSFPFSVLFPGLVCSITVVFCRSFTLRGWVKCGPGCRIGSGRSSTARHCCCYWDNHSLCSGCATKELQFPKARTTSYKQLVLVPAIQLLHRFARLIQS